MPKDWRLVRDTDIDEVKRDDLWGSVLDPSK